MSRTQYFFCLSILTGGASLLIAFNRPMGSVKPVRTPRLARTSESKPLAIPLTFEANVGQAGPQVAFLTCGRRLSTFLTRSGIEVEPRLTDNKHATHRRLQIEFTRGVSPPAERTDLVWKGIEALRAESNYFIGRDPNHWHTHVPHYARAEAHDALPGVDLVAYGNAAADRNEGQLEFDLQIAPDVDSGDLRIKISGADDLRLDSAGDLLMRFADKIADKMDDQQLVIHKPAVYEEVPGRELERDGAAASPTSKRTAIDGAYVLEPDGSVAFRIARRNPHATLVIDPSLSVVYSTFLGGAGEDTANSIAVDSSGKLYIGGTATSASTFPEAVTKTVGPGGGATDFFVAKIDPTASGPSSLLYLTFLGGSGSESGGMIAVDNSGDVAITGTTTSTDFPVTDGSTRTSGPNDIAVAELGPTGATLVYSTLFGGNGSESTQNPGGIALDQSGEIFIASDTTSTDLPVTTGAFQAANSGGISDGFLAIFRPVVTAPTPHLKYCTYLGINAQVGVGGVAIDAGGNAYIAGFTSNPGVTFPTLNGYQTTYAGDPFDAFVIKIRPSGTGPSDLAYGTFLGGAGLDQALAISVGAAMPATAYVTGTTHSTNFPTNGTNAAAQSTLKGTAKGSANAFFSAIGQDATTGMTSLLYSTYLGGTQSDSGLSVASVAPTAVYVAGKTTSWDFPWFNNLQPFTGNEDAFVAKLNPTVAGPASLIYATPLAGTAPPGGTAVTDGNAVAASASGEVYVAGRSTAADFPRAGSPGNGLQPICSSCQEVPAAADAFVLAFQESAAPAPGLAFTSLNINFGAQSVGAQNIPPLFSALINTGDAPLNVSNIALSGPASSSFSFVGSDPCIGTPLPPRATCSFELSFSPTAVGPAEAFVTVTDDAPGSPQVLAVLGLGSGPLAVPSATSIAFGNQPQGSISPAQVITIFNQGNQPLQVTNLTPAGPDKTQFAVQSTTCGSYSILGGGSCSINVVFTPQSIATYQAEIDVIDNSGGLSGAKQVIALSGTGVAAAPIANLSPSSLTFGTLAIGTTSGPQSITLRNVGSAGLTLSQVTFTGTDAAAFGVAASGTTCPTVGGTVAIASNCILQVNFAPQLSGSKNASVNFVDNASGSPQSALLSGTAIAPKLQVSPTALSFAPQSVGIASGSQAITLSNSGTSPVTINQISVAGANASDFNENSNCSSVLGANASCQVSMTFKPTAVGNRSASILVSDDAAGSPQSVSLAGTATQAVVSISPSSVNFTSQLVGTASQPLAVTVTNTGNGALAIASITFSGANPGDFLESDTCKGTIAPAANCVINLTFKPSQVGTRNAAVMLADNAQGTPQSVPLTGVATDFAIDPPSAGATSATVTAGQTAMYQLDVESINGFSGSITLTCTGAPAGAACSTVPTSLAVSANATVPFQVTVSTTARPASAASLRQHTPSPTKPSLPPLSSPLLPLSNVPFNVPVTILLALVLLARYPANQKPPLNLRVVRALRIPSASSRTTPFSSTMPFIMPTAILIALPLLIWCFGPRKPLLNLRAALMSTPVILLSSTMLFIVLAANLIALRYHAYRKRFLNLRVTLASALAISLMVAAIACGGPNAPTQPRGSPAGTYTLTLTASTTIGSATATRTLPLNITVQ
jgi:hypothetical protein